MRQKRNESLTHRCVYFKIHHVKSCRVHKFVVAIAQYQCENARRFDPSLHNLLLGSKKLGGVWQLCLQFWIYDKMIKLNMLQWTSVHYHVVWLQEVQTVEIHAYLSNRCTCVGGIIATHAKGYMLMYLHLLYTFTVHSMNMNECAPLKQLYTTIFSCHQQICQNIAEITWNRTRLAAATD